jgi:hypothetical protein
MIKEGKIKMSTIKRAVTGFLFVGLACLLALLGARSAAAIPALQSITLDPTSGPPGSQVVVTGSGFTPEGAGNLYWDQVGSPLIGSISTVSQNGTFTATAMVPPNATPGLHAIVAYDNRSQASVSADFTVEGKPLEAAYIYDTGIEQAGDFKNLLESTGMISTTLIFLGDVTSTDLSPFDLFLIGPDTSGETGWGDSEAANRIRDTGKPILCIGVGGQAFFGELSLHLGPPFGQASSGQAINLPDTSLPLYQTPYNKSGMGMLTLYISNTQMVNLFDPSRSYVLPLGQNPPGVARAAAQANAYPLAQQAGRYFMWGFGGAPAAMTQDGRQLFINAVWAQLRYRADVDTLILVDYQRMKDIGYASTEVDALEGQINALVALPATQSNMTAVVDRLNLDTPSYVQTARTTWIGNDNSVANTNAYVAALDTYIENLKQGSYPNLQYVIFVGAHEVIPMKARDTDDMTSHPEKNWANGLPQTSGYFYSLYHDPGAKDLGHYLTDSVYGDLSYINNGYGANDELIPELAVGRLVETPAQITTLLGNYIAGNGELANSGKIAIGSADYMDGANMSASHMGYSADTTLIQSSFSSSLVPPAINAHNDIVYIGGHGNYNWMTTGSGQGFMAGVTGSQGDTEELNDMPNAVVVASGCHNGVNFGNMRYHDYTGNTTYGDFPERFVARGVGIYLGSTGYTWISDARTDGSPCNEAACTGWSELLATHFLKHLLNDSGTTAGAAYKAAVNEYVGNYSDFTASDNIHQRVLAIATFYGIPNYHWPPSLAIPWHKYEYWLESQWIIPPEPDPLAPHPVEQIKLNVLDWQTSPSGFLDVPGALSHGGANEPSLPQVHVNHLLSPDSGIANVVWDAGASVSTTIPYTAPLVNLAVLTTSFPNTFTHQGFYPPTPFFTGTASAPGGGGFETGLTITPVQYDPSTHQARIWTTIAFTVEYQVDAYGLGADSDGDGLPDYWESGYGLNPNDAVGGQGAAGDPDQDGVPNTQEQGLGTHPLDPDTDHDGNDDGLEIANGTDPLNPGSVTIINVYLPLVLRN